jgi:hypothetical protein
MTCPKGRASKFEKDDILEKQSLFFFIISQQINRPLGWNTTKLTLRKFRQAYYEKRYQECLQKN